MLDLKFKPWLVTELYVNYLFVRTYIFRSSARLAIERGRYTNIVKESYFVHIVKMKFNLTILFYTTKLYTVTSVYLLTYVHVFLCQYVDIYFCMAGDIESIKLVWFFC